ncbi:MAG: protoheme IX farnesyltransferase [Alphaproteobacteria bacterium CG11_big_fil_rev_8_21_14_0_20_39_49]|nr:MAG: protoheme IX farnesyltransferase [Alphaproteobacteria bacterium CG11_big_fil_rev_8_21_14_0_20_39_49]
MSENIDVTVDSIDISESRIKDYIALLKPRVMSLVVFTGLVGIFLAPGEIHPLIAFVATFCIALGSGAAGAVNMWYERDVDALMKRTKNRPLPSKRMMHQSALEFAVVSAFISVLLMSLAVNLMAGFLLLLAILFYVFVYTIWLKKRTPQNIVIGGAAGAFPPMIGWAAVTGDVSFQSFLLFLIIFLWTPPHFWALALYKNEDYKAANIPMLPVVAGDLETRKQIYIYTVILFAASMLPIAAGMFGTIYLVSAFALGIYFMKLAKELYGEYSEVLARKTFKFSLLYLSVLFFSMIIDRIL